MLNTIIRRIAKHKNTSFSLLFLGILVMACALPLRAAPKSDKTKKNNTKDKRISPSKSSPILNGPKQLGKWDPTETFSSSFPAVHMSVLPNGKVLYWGGGLGGPNNNQTKYEIWNPKPLLGQPSLITDFVPASFGNLYCSGHSFLHDGRLLVTGGQEGNTSQKGINKASVFDHSSGPTGQWTQVPDMNNRRWYPTNLTLGNGNTLVWAGVTENGGINSTPQILEKQLNGTFSWRSLSISNPEAHNLYYSWPHLLSSGKVLVSVGYMRTSFALSIGDAFQQSRLYRYPLHSTNPNLDGVLNDPHEAGSSVIFDKDRIMLVGGADYPKQTAEIIDMSDPNPQWKRAGPLNTGRRHLNATLLADGQILVTGGNKGTSFNNNCPENFVYHAEMWDPADPGIANATYPLGVPGKWKQLASATQPRLYHSSAVLLPDGRVLTGGSTEYSDLATTPPTPEKPNPYWLGCSYVHVNNTQMEIFSPPYLFNEDGTKATRPVITNAPTLATYGQTISFTVSNAAAGSKVNLIRLPSVTHSFNQNQGIVKPVTTINGQNFTAAIPANRNECPPGHYMMFVVNTAGVPSEAAIIQVL